MTQARQFSVFGNALVFVLGLLAAVPGARADASWSVSHWLTGSSLVSGSGVRREESREVGSFDSIDLHDSTDIEVSVGPSPSLRIEADENILPLISTTVEHGTLIIRSTGSYRTHRGPRIVLTTPSLNRLSLDGSGDAILNHLSGGPLDLSISGSGDIRADGRVDALKLRINGSGDASLSDLQAANATVAINGSGDASLNVSDSIDAVVNGSGDVSYRGNPPRVSSRVHGSGEISRR